MNITPQSMEQLIMRNMSNDDVDPHLKKLLAELNSLKAEIYGKKPEHKKEPTVNDSEQNVVFKTSYPIKKRKRRSEDAAFRASIAMFSERRKSDRLSGKCPSYKLMEDIDDLENQNLYSNGRFRSSTGGIERTFFRRRDLTSDRVILMPEEITPEMLNNICYKLNDRIYDKVNGSSCHQCRQKTLDTKTICRNLDCYGVRGQFCGPCAKNRYGVDVADALLDPYWSCFVCQGICNCSFCRNRKGLRPTGILAPIAKRKGHESVKEFLDEIKKIDEGDNYKYAQDPESVLGFANPYTVSTLNGTEEMFNLKEMDSAPLVICGIIELLENDTCFNGFISEDATTETEQHKLERIIESLSWISTLY